MQIVAQLLPYAWIVWMRGLSAERDSMRWNALTVNYCVFTPVQTRAVLHRHTESLREFRVQSLFERLKTRQTEAQVDSPTYIK